MTRLRLVVDASVLAKSASMDEPDTAIALRYLQRRYEVLAPAIASSELGNVAHRKDPKAFGGDARERAATLENILDGVSLVAPTVDLRGVAGKACAAHGLSFYDAEYVALAELTPSSILVSDDRGMVAAGKVVLGRQRALSLQETQDAIRRKLI